MGIGILVCGLNGCCKSTIGKALAYELGFRFIDNEDLFFPKSDPNYLYATPRSKDDVEKLLMDRITAYPNFVFAAVKGYYGKEIISLFDYAVLIDVPNNIRLRRVKDRSFQKIGKRMLLGGDLYEHEESFFELVRSRADNMVEEWLKSIRCPVIHVDGTKPVEENISTIIRIIKTNSSLRQ